jgi:hypothetical protein
MGQRIAPEKFVDGPLHEPPEENEIFRENRGLEYARNKGSGGAYPYTYTQLKENLEMSLD